MFGLWYIVFGVAFIAIMALVGLVLFSKLYDKNYWLYKNFRDIYYYSDTKKERQEAKADKEKYGKITNRYQIVGNISSATLVISCVVLIILILVSIFIPIGQKEKCESTNTTKSTSNFPLQQYKTIAIISQ